MLKLQVQISEYWQNSVLCIRNKFGNFAENQSFCFSFQFFAHLLDACRLSICTAASHAIQMISMLSSPTHPWFSEDLSIWAGSTGFTLLLWGSHSNLRARPKNIKDTAEVHTRWKAGPTPLAHGSLLSHLGKMVGRGRVGPWGMAASAPVLSLGCQGSALGRYPQTEAQPSPKAMSAKGMLPPPWHPAASALVLLSNPC